jgi:ribosome recycling factor
MSNLNEMYEKMEKSFDALANDLATIRAGRANPKILDKVSVDYYGSPTPLSQVAAISVPEARLIMIKPWDKSILKEIEKAINVADVGINPTNDGTCVRLVFPELNEDRRKELTKDVKKRGEDAKVSIRNIRRDCIEIVKKMEKDGEATEDDKKQLDDEIQKKVDKFIEKIDKAVEDKSKEIMTV